MQGHAAQMFKSEYIVKNCLQDMNNTFDDDYAAGFESVDARCQAGDELVFETLSGQVTRWWEVHPECHLHLSRFLSEVIDRDVQELIAPPGWVAQLL